jgi:predicted enzyme related to lactoylglutathione lyase
LRLVGTFYLLMLFLLTGCSSSPINLPAITENATGKHLPGKVIWHDLISHKPIESKRFYSELFGWEFEDLGLDLGFGRTVNYSLIRHQGQLIGGMVDANHLGRGNPEDLSQWVVVLFVKDINKATSQVMANGGRVLTPPRDVAERGTLALIEDSQGATLALLQTRHGDPAEQTPPIGGFLWDEVWPVDVTAASKFYTSLFNLAPATHNNKTGTAYQFLTSSSGIPRFGLLQQPIKALPPTWVSYIRVDNPAAITAKVSGLGGQVLVGAQKRDVGGEVALIADPSGAGIAIQSWPGKHVTSSIKE